MKARKRMCMVICAVLFLLVTGLASWAQQKIPVSKDNKLTIGLSGPLSGPAAVYGQHCDRAITLAIEDINNRGGIKVGNVRYKLQHKTYDHAFDPAKAVEITKKMMSLDKVAWILSMGTAVTKPIIPFTEENKTIVMGATTGRGILTFMKQNYTYKFVTSTPEATFLGWQWIAKNHPEWKTTVEIGPDDESGWDTLKDMRELILPKFGIKLVDEAFYRRGTTEFYPILVKLLAKKPDVFDMNTISPPAVGRIIKQARELGYKGQFIYPNGGGLAPIVEIAGSFADGLIFGANVFPPSPFATPEEKAFYDKYMKVYGPPWDFHTIEYPNGIYSVAQAIEKANSLDPDKVIKVLQTTEYHSLGRKLKFGGVSVYGPPQRQVIQPYGVYVIEKGKPKMIDLVHLPAEW